MKQSKSLYNQLVGAFIFTTFAISALYGLLVYNAMKFTEDDILNRRVQLETQNFVDEYIKNPTAAKLPHSIGMRGYLSSSQNMPPWLKDQPLGFRELHDREVHVNVSELPESEERIFIVLDEHISSNLTQQTSRLFLILFSVGVVITVVGLVIGSALGKYITNPLQRLTQEIEAYNTEPDSIKLPFYGHDQLDETGALSRSFTLLVERLSDFLNRERQFTRHASHELRSPLTVIYNALAVLQMPEATELSKQKSLTRIENSANEMESLIATFLILGRENPRLEIEQVDLFDATQSSIEKYRHLQEGFQLHKNTPAELPIFIQTDKRMLQVLLDNVIRNLYLHGANSGTLWLTHDSLVVENRLKNYSESEKNSDHSYGIEIIKRIGSTIGATASFETDTETFKCTILF